MILFNKFSGLALIFSLLVMPQIFAMEPMEPVKYKKKRDYSKQSEALGEGHQGEVFDGSPMKNLSPAKRNAAAMGGLEVPSVRKKLKFGEDVDYTNEAIMQMTIREAIRFENEKLIRHIPKVDYFEKDFIKMEKAIGERLEVCLCSLAPKEFLLFMLELMEFVELMHKAGYSHEDLSLTNLMVDRKNLSNFWVLDYELSGKIGEHIRYKCGAFGYSAPEMKIRDVIGNEADVFSLGKIMAKYFAIIPIHYDIYYLIENMTHEDPARRLSLHNAIGILTYILENYNLDFRKVQINTPNRNDRPIAGYETTIEGYKLNVGYENL